jgi:hypothetical protein
MSRPTSSNVIFLDLTLPLLGILQEEEEEVDHWPTRTAQLAQVRNLNPEP